MSDTPVPDDIRACWADDGVMHTCTDPDLCEELDTRPPVDALGTPRKERHLRSVPPSERATRPQP